jgi:cytochrome oxidase assembly protein ShyY1
VWSVARRPRWIAALVFALLVAAGFAALGQWQLERSVQAATTVERASENVVPLRSVALEQSPVTSDAAYQMVTIDGTLVPGDSSVVSGRLNGGVTGYWVVAHVVTEDGASLAVALGWTESKQAADAAAADSVGLTVLVPWVGRYLPSESPQEANFEQGERNTVSVAALINEWSVAPGKVYGGYLVSAEAPNGLTVIDSPAPTDEVTVNWLNIFYAVEWAVFAGFAIFLWYRLVRDAWEREEEEAAELAELN